MLSAESEAALLVSAPLTAAAACISTATSRGVLGPLSGDDSCKPLVQFKGWLECNKTVLKADQDERTALRNKYNTTFLGRGFRARTPWFCQSSVPLPGQTPLTYMNLSQ